ncbi:MAG: 30S ribosomal protein S6 [Deltaproteobacteria bacterium]|nr:30S ribosomal protein S6 [Deltaproteobacteria bacterium]
MREYETLYILKSNTPEKEVEEFGARLIKLIEAHKGKALINRSWGRRQFAYLMEKEKEGIYIHLDYVGDNTLVQELEKALRYEEKILRFLTVVLHENVNIEKRVEEIEKAEIAAKEAQIAAQAVTA